MASDYAAIRLANREEYGAGIGRWGKGVLASRYDDRTHFIFELLQNAEDALGRRAGWQGSRAVSLRLADQVLSISHFGRPFDERDVRGICGIAESTKDLTAIGRFGIGFKSVYAFTDRPEVHSGEEDFAIEDFVCPTTAKSVDRSDGETIINLPLKDDADRLAIAKGLQTLGARTLLFLRQIEEITWSVDGGPSGVYLRESKEVSVGVRRVVLVGQEHRRADSNEEWLIFSRPVTSDDGRQVGHVELAFGIAEAPESKIDVIQRVEQSPLVVFFPTILETHLGFLVQGPYRTTPSRDNVPRSDVWNQRLVAETASLLVTALRWLRDSDLLDTSTLRCLPLDPEKFGEASMFAPLFQATVTALSTEPLLPRFDGGHVSASSARLGRTQELRELFSPAQLSILYQKEPELAWLSGDITLDRAPELRDYIMKVLDVDELTPEAIIPRLDGPFLQAQSDAWILDLYEFLNGQPALLRRGLLRTVPIVRLGDGTQVVANLNGEPQAFLPGVAETGFPTVRRAVCATEEARTFLLSLGLTEPDPVDDVVRNVLGRYRGDEIDVSDADYEADIRRILVAFATDSKVQREKLVAALRESSFVMAVDAGDQSELVSKPGDVYLATERLKSLFAGVPDVPLVDDGYPCLRGEDVRDLLEACGATRYLQPVPVSSRFSWQELTEMRKRAGAENNTGADRVDDFNLRGLTELFAILAQLAPESAAQKAAVLWEALCDFEDRRGAGAFLGTYKWFYFHQRSCVFDASFVQQLNSTAWVPDANGHLQRPEFVVFSSLGWKPNPFLLSKVHFKPPAIEALAREAGIEPGLLDLLKKLGVTSEAELRDRLGIKEPTASGNGAQGSVADALKKLLGGGSDPTPPVLDPTVGEPLGSSRRGDGKGSGSGQGAAAGSGPGRPGAGGSRWDGPGASGDSAGPPKGAAASAGKRLSGSNGSRTFISYLAVDADGDEADPDGLDQGARMALEAQAVALILAREPKWLVTPAHNPGFDLYEAGEDGTPTRWCEVKAMAGSLENRPVGLSRTQFECAQKRAGAYWLYIVEHAGTEQADIVRIQDPAGKAQTFAFDRGWRAVADVDAEENAEGADPHGKD